MTELKEGDRFRQRGCAGPLFLVTKIDVNPEGIYIIHYKWRNTRTGIMDSDKNGYRYICSICYKVEEEFYVLKQDDSLVQSLIYAQSHDQ